MSGTSEPAQTPDTFGHANGKGRLLLTGATGYIGGRLGPRLLERGYRVRCVVRSAPKLLSRPWANDPRVEVVETDLGNVDRLANMMRGCRAAYYLVHSMQASGGTYAEQDRRLAASFARAAEQAELERIVYLGGLGETGDRLSTHLGSRRQVEQVLAAGAVPVTVLRAAMIIGSGSASFEILRYLVERLPIMVTPRWVNTQVQPIAVRNVLHDLVTCLEVPETSGQTLDIGGPDVLTYRELLQTAAAALGLRRRLILPVPVLTPRLSSLWIHLVTPLPYRLARPLGEGLRNRVVCRDDRAQALMPQRLLSVREAIDRALGKLEQDEVDTTWHDAGVVPGDAPWAGGTEFVDERRVTIMAPAETVFNAVGRIGGGHGWYSPHWLWRLRGALDRVVGGPGLRRGRRHPESIGVGDALDFWRVVTVDSPRQLRLHAEMRLPGEAYLTFTIETDGADRCILTQIASFRPHGLAGLAYWYAVRPLHGFLFRAMLRGVRESAENAARRPTPTGT